MKRILVILFVLLLCAPCCAAITGTDRGTGTDNTSALTFTVTPASNFSSGTLAVLVISADNSDTNGTAHSTFAVTDSHGNTWTRRFSLVLDPAGASAGCEGAVFTTTQTAGTLTTGSTITVTFDAASTAECWSLMEITPTAGHAITYVTNGNSGAFTNTAPTVDTGSITSGNMVIGCLFNEQGTGQTVAEDGDSTNGSWSTQQTAEIGSAATGMTVASQRKVVTGTATQTYNPTLGTASDSFVGWVQFSETPTSIIDPLSRAIPGNALDPLRSL